MASLIETRRNILMSSPHLTSASGSLATFNTDLSAPLKEMKVHFYPVQASGTPSPDNVLPISGWDGVTVTRTIGEDLYVYNVTNMTTNTTVTKINDNSFRLSTPGRSYPASRQYIETLGLTIGKHYFVEFDANVITLAEGHRCIFGFRNSGNTYQADARSIVDTSGHYSFDFVYDDSTRLRNLSLCEISGSAVAFDAEILNLRIYECESIPITFPQTIYGGYVDLVKGEVVEEYGSDGQPITPQAYPLTPQTIKTLKGINNIFSDANGNVDVTYWKH